MTMEDDDEGPAAPAAAASPIKGLASASLVSATSLPIGTMREGKEGKEEEALNEEGASKLMDTAVVDGVNADDENMKDAESDAAASPTKNDVFNEASAISSSRSASSETEIAGTIINNEDSPAHSASDGTKSDDDDVIAVNNSSATQRKNDIVETAAPVIDSSATQRKNGIVETGALVIDRSAKQRKNDVVETAALVATSVTKPANDNTNLHSKKQDFVLSFEDLTCHVPGISSKCCVSRDNPMTNYLEYYLGIQVQERDPFYSLDSCSGWLKSGEMCLVLGSNDQSKSTLLRALCGRLNTQDELYGTILLDGMPLGHSNQGWRRLSPYVSASDTSHSPVLTVRETFTFAAQCSCTDPAKIEVSVNHLMETLGLMNVADTVVGDENLRGISGGQKRRVTIGEMMLDPESSFLCLENITDGLASTDSYSLIDNIGRACKKYRMAAIISLLQPSDEMVHLFDKLLVLTATGEQAYFGPVDRKVLRSVFLGPDADPSEDSGSICDLVLKHSLHGSFRKEDSIVKTFAESPVGDDLTRKLKNIRTNAPPARERNVDALLPDKKYSTSRWYQFKILCGRRRKLISRNAVTYTRIGIAIFFGIIIGSLFSALDNSIMGSLGRTGYMFLNSFLVLMLSAAVTIPSSFRERVTLFKQRSAEFYSGRVAYLSQVLMDLPLSVLEAVLLSSISYFWVDMNQGANHFFFFMGTLIALECVGQALGRLLCALLRKQVSANAMSSVLILLCGTVAGFMPQYTSITWVLRWLSWITPVSYAFEAMMINEFYGRTLDPLTLGDGDGTRLLSIQGSAWLNNFSLPRVQWASYEGIKIFDIFMILLFALIYDLIGMYYIEHTREWYYNQIRRPQATVKRSFEMETKGRDNEEEKDVEKSAANELTEFPQTLSVKGLSYSVRVKAERKGLMTRMKSLIVRCSGKNVEKVSKESTLTLLNGVEAQFRRGRMCCLMGTSGAGKTTLMDVIAGYKTGGKITGTIMIDNMLKDEATWQKISGYAEQNDILNPYLTVMETLRFTASCRLAHDVDKEERVQQILELMDLGDYANFVIGREQEGEGLEKHVRKRVTIAVQLVIRPRVLFLDEPTTGLGNNAAALVIRAVRRSTDAMGIITLATIHQPSKFIWETFDDALLLSKGGRVAYMGESQNVVNYFSSLMGEEAPERCNPADYALGALSSMSPDEAKTAFGQSDGHAKLEEEIASTTKLNSDGKSLAPYIDLRRPNNPIQEVALLTKRQLVVQWRNPSYCFMRLTMSVVVSVYMGLLFFGDKTKLSGAVSSIGAIFFLVFILVIPMQAAVVPLIEDRAVLYRETVSGTYARLSYGVGQLFADIPFHMLNTVLMWACFYFLVGFQTSWGNMGYFLLQLFLANFVITSLGQLFALVTPNEESANGLAGLSVMLSVILMGFLITANSMPSGWVWAYWANLFRYMLQGFCTNELVGKVYQINLDLGLNSTMNDSAGLFENATSFVGFAPGADGTTRFARQSANLLNLASESGGGINQFIEQNSLISLVRCLTENSCLEDRLASNFIQCTLFKLVGTPPCKDEFDAATEDIDIGAIAQCFLPGNETSSSENATDIVPEGFSFDTFDALKESSQRDTLLCLLRTVLPPGTQDAINSIVETIKSLSGIVMFIVDIVRNGLQIPGEIILFFFGWALFEDFEFVAPWKWWYCMGSVAIFWAAIELFKIIAVQKIVWTKR